MTLLMAIVALLGVVFGGLALFLRADPRRLADSFRAIGPALIALIGAATALGGRGVVGALAFVAALAWWGLARNRRRATPLPERRSMVRTAALEMELDRDTGALEGLVLAGSAEGRTLGSMGLAELRQVYRELTPDPDSLRLLEAYLDGRFPVWRHHAHTDDGEGLGIAPRTRAMTKEEAYEILGLQAGAAAADIREAHRRLMQRLNPDIERSSFLAARIDEAKDVLLSDHG